MRFSFLSVFCTSFLLCAQAILDPSVRLTTVAQLPVFAADAKQIITDSKGNIYVAGTTSASDFPVTSGAAQSMIGDALMLQSNDLGATWNRLPYHSPKLNSVATDPNNGLVLFGVSFTAVFKTLDGGKSWHTIWNVPNTRIGQVLVDPADSRSVFAIGSKFSDSSHSLLLVSADGGESWEQRQVAFSQYSSSSGALWVDPFGGGAIGYDEFLSVDRGLTWTTFIDLPSRNIAFTTPSPWKAGQLFTVQSKTLARSDDWGKHWTFQDHGLPNEIPRQVTFDPDVPGTIYEIVQDGVRVSQDYGTTWRLVLPAISPYTIPAPGSVAYPVSVVAFPARCGAPVVLASGGSGISISKDGGEAWQTKYITRLGGLVTGAGCTVYATGEI